MSVDNQEPYGLLLDDQDDYHTANKIPVMSGVQGVSRYQRVNNPGYYHDADKQVELDRQVAEAGFSMKVFLGWLIFYWLISVSSWSYLYVSSLD